MFDYLYSRDSAQFNMSYNNNIVFTQDRDNIELLQDRVSYVVLKMALPFFSIRDIKNIALSCKNFYHVIQSKTSTLSFKKLPAIELFQEYTKTFFSKELDFTHLQLEGNRLELYLEKAAKMPHLTAISLNAFYNDEKVNLEVLKNLKFLKKISVCLHNNNRESLHSSIPTMPNIEYIQVRMRSFSHLSIKNFPLFVRLHTLDLSYTDLERIHYFSHIHTVKTLKILKLLAVKGLKKEGIDIIASCKDLQSLNLSFCIDLEDQDLEALHRLSSLQELVLLGCRQLKGAFLDSIRVLVNLRELSLGGLSDLKIKSGQSLKELTFLQSLSLEGIIEIDDDMIIHKVPVVHLMKLDLSYTLHITFESINYLAKLSSIQILDLSGAKIVNDELLELLKGFTFLKKLLINDSIALTDNGIVYCQSFTQLEAIELICCNELTLRSLEDLASVLSLKKITISSKKISYLQFIAVKSKHGDKMFLWVL